MPDFFPLAASIVNPGYAPRDEVEEGFERLIGSLQRQAEALEAIADELVEVGEAKP